MWTWRRWHGIRTKMSERFLVTGALGCIGAWVVRQLVREGAAVTALDVGDDDHRWRWLMAPDEIAAVRRAQADITDLPALEQVLDAERVTRIIHLAALQVPFCRADPPLGARVNVLGAVNVFEAVARRADRIGPVVYASSIAAYDASTLYGVFKRANEGTAHVYWADHAVASIGLRPHTVFGVGRDQGLTSAPTKAMLAAAAGRPYRIPFGGRGQLQHAADVARTFIAAARADAAGAEVHDLGGRSIDMADVVAAIVAAAPESAGRLSFDDDVLLPFPEEVDAHSLAAAIGPVARTPFHDAVADTVASFRSLIAAGLIAWADEPSEPREPAEAPDLRLGP
jgi:UDP-glucuronate 4-epimerase